MNQKDIAEADLIIQHENEHKNHRFHPTVYRGTNWDLSHLDPYAFFVDIAENKRIAVVIIFTCHCFTHALKNDEREEIPPDELYETENETRVLNEKRYIFSKELLLDIVKNLHSRRITVADAGRNFVTIEQIDQNGNIVYYGVYFEVSKSKHRSGRVILRVQSAYQFDNLQNRQKNAKKVRFSVLIKATYEGRKIKQ